MHVQSGIWSFRFKHSRGEDGLGMVTPLEASFDDLPRDVVTRITLRFSETTTNDYQRLLSELDGIPETTILHLHRLRQIVIQRPNHVFRIQRLDYHNPKRHALKKQRRSTILGPSSKVVTTHSMKELSCLRTTDVKADPTQWSS